MATLEASWKRLVDISGRRREASSMRQGVYRKDRVPFWTSSQGFKHASGRLPKGTRAFSEASPELQEYWALLEGGFKPRVD